MLRWRGGVLAAMTLLFVLAIRELGSSLLSHQQHHGDVGAAARLLRRRQSRQDRAFSLVQMVLLGVLIGGANWLSRGAAQGSVVRSG